MTKALFVSAGTMSAMVLLLATVRYRRSRQESRFCPEVREALKTARQYTRSRPRGAHDLLLAEAHKALRDLPGVDAQIKEEERKAASSTLASVKIYATNESRRARERVMSLSERMMTILEPDPHDPRV